MISKLSLLVLFEDRHEEVAARIALYEHLRSKRKGQCEDANISSAALHK
jgi:hypothetical protein